MSLRKSLYKQYTTRSTTSFVNLTDASMDDKHWAKDWYDPPRSSKDTLIQQAQQQTQQGSGVTPVSGIITPVETTPAPQSAASNNNNSNSNNGSASNSTTNLVGQVNGSSASQSQTPQPMRTYGYKIKTWVLTDRIDDSNIDCLDEENDTKIQLENCGYLVNSAFGSNVQNGGSDGLNSGSGVDGNGVDGNGNGSGGLTEADIKSAVGGTGGSALFSSSAALAMKEDEEAKKAEEEEADGDVKMS